MDEGGARLRGRCSDGFLTKWNPIDVGDPPGAHAVAPHGAGSPVDLEDNRRPRSRVRRRLLVRPLHQHRCPDLRQRHRWFCAGAGGVFFRGDRWGERRGGPPVPGDNAVTRAAGRRGRGHWFARLRARNRHRHATATVRGRAGKGAWDGGKVDQGGVSQEVTSRRGTCHCTLGIGDAQRR